LIVTETLLAFFHSETPTNVSQRTLTFAERVGYQRVIEDVYWRHRIWPRNRGERPDLKPSLDAVMSQAQLEKKVGDYLRKSQALEDYWQRPITADQLQAEVDRMAKHTKQPEVLRELFEALGNDPFVIAECLARPALADRLVTNWYAYDQRIHGALKQRAEAELQAHPTVEEMKRLSGKYTEIELVRSDEAGKQDRHGPVGGVQLNSQEWEQTLQRLAAVLGHHNPVEAGVSPAQPERLPLQERAGAGNLSPEKRKSITQINTGALSTFQEDEECYYATAVIKKSNDRLRLATVTWLKESRESWLARAENQVPRTMEPPNADYMLPEIVDGSECIEDTWTATAGPPDGRYGHTAIWTGSEMIVWGGTHGNVSFFNTGGRYNPSTDTWTPTSASNAPTARAYHTAVWTGSEMIVWGG